MAPLSKEQKDALMAATGVYLSGTIPTAPLNLTSRSDQYELHIVSDEVLYWRNVADGTDFDWMSLISALPPADP